MADGTLTVAVGASRSGKTAFVRQQLKAGSYGLCLIWDVEGQYHDSGATVLQSKRELAALVRGVANGSHKGGRVAYTTKSLAHFGYFADCAFLLAQVCNARGIRFAVVAEELADVTTPGKAPDEWGILIRRGLKYGADIFAITQRPAESDKTIMGNASVIHCCGLQRAGDRKYMAAEMDVPLADIASLVRDSTAKPPRLEYMHKDCRTGQTTRAFLTF